MRPREQRKKVFIDARMRFDGHWTDVRILDASSRGFLIQTPTELRRGCYIEVYRGPLRYIARVVWQANRQCGVHTQDKVVLDQLISPTASRDEKVTSQGGTIERREQIRYSETMKQRADISRHFGKMLEYIWLVGLGVAAAMLIVGGLHDALVRPLEQAAARL